MRRAFIIAPNIGVFFGGGGGVKVALHMALALLEHGFKVHLVALTGWDAVKLGKIHGINLSKFVREGRLVLNYAFRIKNDSKTLFSAISSPIIEMIEPSKTLLSLAIKYLSIYIKQLVREYLPDLVIFHDDVPKLDDKMFKHISKVVLYSHFPYAARSYFNIVDAVEVGLERYSDWRMRHYHNALKNIIYFNSIPKEVELVANSTVTKIFMEIIWRKKVKVLYPPILPKFNPTVNYKENSVVLVGGQPNKRVGDAIKALAKLKNLGKTVPKLHIVAYYFIPWYKDWLFNLTYRYGLQHSVYFIESIPESDLFNIYTTSKVILSTARFEPFGMSVAEGMFHYAIPIVYKGVLSGPWIDIIDKGKYGIGFKSIDELTENINYVINAGEDELTELQRKAFSGSQRFSLNLFKENFLKLVYCGTL